MSDAKETLRNEKESKTESETKHPKIIRRMFLSVPRRGSKKSKRSETHLTLLKKS